MGTEWALEPTGNQLVGPTGTLAPLGRSTGGTICPRSAVGRPNGTRLRLRLLRVLWTNGRLPKELPKHGSPRRTYIYVGGVLSPHGAATDNGCPLIRGPPGGGLGSH